MSHTKVHCQRGDCGKTFTVEDGLEAARCTHCGQKHTPPWNPEPDGIAADGGATIEAPANATIHITIEVVPEDSQ